MHGTFDVTEPDLSNGKQVMIEIVYKKLDPGHREWMIVANH